MKTRFSYTNLIIISSKVQILTFITYRGKKRVFANSMTREILGERPKIKYSQFLKQNLNKEGLKTLLIDLDETLVC